MAVEARDRRCVLEKRAWERLESYLRRLPATEKCGLGLGFEDAGRSVVLAYLWPKQTSDSGAFCSFDVADLGALLPLIVDLRRSHGVQGNAGIVAWVHTHPRIGLFLSGTDRGTLGRLAAFDDSIAAVVFDVFAREGPAFKAFDARFAEIPSVVGDVELDPAWLGLTRELVERVPPELAGVGSPPEALITPHATHIGPSGASE
jgi:hypothetical protein